VTDWVHLFAGLPAERAELAEKKKGTAEHAEDLNEGSHPQIVADPHRWGGNDRGAVFDLCRSVRICGQTARFGVRVVRV